MTAGVGAKAVGARSGLRYVEVAQHLAREIAGGLLAGQLPAERELCQRFGVSRVTLRRALERLAEDGLVTPSWGRGWYVTDRPLSEPPNALLSFTDLAERRGLAASTRVLSVTERGADLDEAGELRIAPGARIAVVERLRLLEEVPTVFQRSFLPCSRLPGLMDGGLGQGSLYRFLGERCGRVPVRADYTVEARPSPPDIAAVLAVEPGSALLCTTQTTYDQEGQVVEWGWGAFPHDRYRFRATLSRMEPVPLASGHPRRGSGERRKEGER